MAKKRKKEKKQEEEYEFKPPEFNEREFLVKEIRDTRTAIVTVGIAVLFGVIAAVITALTSSLAGVAFLVGIAGIFALKYFYQMLKLDVSGFTRKNWAGTIVTYFFTFLAIWVLIINTPFADLTNPSIDEAVVWVNDGANVKGIAYEWSESANAMVWTPLNETDVLATMIHTSGSYTINITAHVADSGGLSGVDIAVTSTSSWQSMVKGVSGKFEHTVNGADLAGQGTLTFFILAKDKHGNEQMFSPGSIPISP